MPPERYKTDDELSTEEIAQRMAAKQRGESRPRFETDEYREARKQALADAGLDDVDELDDKPLEDLDVGEHFDRLRRN